MTSRDILSLILGALVLSSFPADAADRRGDRRRRPPARVEEKAEENAEPAQIEKKKESPAKKIDLEYLVKIDDKLKWVIASATAVGFGRNSVRVRTDPPFGLPGDHGRLAVFRNGEHIGFLRMLQSYVGGCLVGPIGGSMDPSDLKPGDVFRQFETIQREKKPPAELSAREKKRVVRAVTELGHSSYKTREEATAFLKTLGTQVLPLIADATRSHDPEVRTRARDVAEAVANQGRLVKPDLARILIRRSGVHKPMQDRGFLGISMSDVEEGKKPGAQVVAIVKETPAEKVGLKIGDIILSIDDDILNDSTDLLEVVSARNPGDKIKMKVKRDDKELDMEATLGRRPPTTELLRK